MTPLMGRLIYPALWPHPNGTWYILYDRKHRRSLQTRDRAEARAVFRELAKEARQGRITLIATGCPPKKLVDFWEEYQEYRLQTASRFSCQTDKQAFRVFRQALGDETKLTRLNRAQIDKALAQLGRRVSRSSANTWFRHFKAALGKAVAWGYLKENPAAGIKALKIQKRAPRYLTSNEAAALLTAEADARFKNLWIFFLLTGCRRSEALQLSARHIDPGAGCIHIPEAKNREARLVWLTPDLDLLVRQLPEVGRWFPWKPDTVTHKFAAAARKAGLKCRLHDLRHTYASHKAMAGVNLYTLKELLGHQDIKATQIYSHLSDQHLKAAAKKGIIGG